MTRAYFEINGQRFSVTNGDLVKVKAGNLHSIVALEDTFARFIPIRFPYESEKVQGEYNPIEVNS